MVDAVHKRFNIDLHLAVGAWHDFAQAFGLLSNRIGRNTFEAIFSHRLLDCRHFLDVTRCRSASVD
jgi:hypothetical protein